MQVDKAISKYNKNYRFKDKLNLNNYPQKKVYDFFIVIPAYCEELYIPFTLESINKQNLELLNTTLVVIVINNSKKEQQKIKNNNKRTFISISKKQFNFELIIIDCYSSKYAFSDKLAGVGLARKIGADLAIQYSHSSSILCYTDADAVLSNDYLKIIARYYDKYNCGCAIVNFRHQKHKDSIINKNIRKYEKFLFKTAEDLKNAESPYGYVSLGSCITCTSYAYISVGGMNKMKATEDFYFLQDLTKHFEHMHIINHKIVYPSSRISTRVYLGTGYRMKQIIEGEEIDGLYFSKQSFENLNQFLLIIKKSYGLNINELLNKTNDITKLNSFLNREGIHDVWGSLINNVDYKKFISQFHRWFDGLKTIKFLKYFS